MKPERIKTEPVVKRKITGIAGIIGKAAIDKEFREKFLAKPAEVAKEYGLHPKRRVLRWNLSG